MKAKFVPNGHIKISSDNIAESLLLKKMFKGVSEEDMYKQVVIVWNDGYGGSRDKCIGLIKR
jgi:hypothetical protein